MDIHIHIHSVPEQKIDLVLSKLETIMAKIDELNAELVAINDSTNEIANDINDLISKVGEGSLSPTEAEEIKSQLITLREKLTGIAATHTT